MRNNSIKTIKCNLITLALEGHLDVIVHGCNCYHTMGAGIAKSIRTNFPDAYSADLATVKGDKNKLGTISWAEIDTPYGLLVVVNGYTQIHWKGGGILLDYKALGQVFATLKSKFTGKRIG